MDTVKTLFLAANPSNTTPLKLDEEFRAITQKVRASEYRDVLSLVSAWAVRADDLLQAFNEHKPQVVHFSGHGSKKGEIILLDTYGDARTVSTAALKALFRTFSSNIRVVVLNACYSQIQANAIIRVIECAVGMSDAINDMAAIIFASSFYRAIGFGHSIQRAFDEGITALLLEGYPDADLPQLLCRSGVDASQIFLISSQNSSPTLVESSASINLQSKTGIFTTSSPNIITLDSPVYLHLVRIPSGRFLMGSDLVKDFNARQNEQPQHLVYLSEYFISKYPITNAQYASFLHNTTHPPPKHWRNGRIPNQKENHPVVNISWEDALSFCKWLSNSTRKSFRLPTEAEWEKAGRGTDGSLYPWGDEWNVTRCNSRSSKLNDTTPVGQYSPSSDSIYGVADMSGNVWEWCIDWFDENEYQWRLAANITDPLGPSLEGLEKVVRGGSWLSMQVQCRVACRYMAEPNTFDESLGFRIVLSSNEILK